MNTMLVTDLHNWSENPRTMTQAGKERLESQLALGQFKPLIVSKDDEGKFVVLGGNMRLSILKEQGVEQVGVVFIDFIQEGEVWYATIDGQRVATRSFPTRKDGMMEYSLADNSRSGEYDPEAFANLMPNYSINWDDYAIDIAPPQSIEELVEAIAPTQVEEQPKPNHTEPQEVVCPACQHAFTIS